MTRQKRAGMAMIMAIAVLVIVGTIMALSIAMTTQTTKRNLDMYLYEQIEMLADSAREYAMYKIDNNATHCGESGFNILGQDAFYDVSVAIKYVTSNGCVDGVAANNFITDSDLQQDTAIIDVTVSVDKTQTNTTEDIRFYKKYIENIKP